MSTYIVLANYTEQGIANIKQSPGRLTAANKALKSIGGRFKDFYLTMGGYDFVCVIEAPNDLAAAGFALTVGAQGNVRTTTMLAFPEPEYRKIVKALP